jgi:hypothetical protein
MPLLQFDGGQGVPMKAKLKIKYFFFPQMLALALLTSGCAADFLFEGNKNQQTKNEDDRECECDEPHPSPSPTATPCPPTIPTPTPTPKPAKPPCPRKPPQVSQCNLRVIIDVAQLMIVKSHGQAELITIAPGSIDLCELSKDFFSTLNRSLSPSWRSGDSFTKVIFLLSSRVERNRVETMEGTRVCALRLPPGMTAGTRFEPVGSYPLPVATGLRVTFDFDQNDALHSLGFGICQLQHPVGHFDLRQGP